jgi:hypothetical protein
VIAMQGVTFVIDTHDSQGNDIQQTYTFECHTPEKLGYIVSEMMTGMVRAGDKFSQIITN